MAFLKDFIDCLLAGGWYGDNNFVYEIFICHGFNVPAGANDRNIANASANFVGIIINNAGDAAVDISFVARHFIKEHLGGIAGAN